MVDTIFRTKSEEPKTESIVPQKAGDGAGVPDIKVEAPFTEYEHINHHPYIVDHYKLGDTWQDKLGGFEKEVSTIEDYFKGEISNGKLKNEVSAVKEKIDKIYKLVGIDKTERTTMQIEKLAAYLEFLKKTDYINLSNYKYGRQSI